MSKLNICVFEFCLHLRCRCKFCFILSINEISPFQFGIPMQTKGIKGEPPALRQNYLNLLSNNRRSQRERISQCKQGTDYNVCQDRAVSVRKIKRGFLR